MRNRVGVGLRTWVLGAAATGLLSQSLPVVGQTKNYVATNPKKPVSAPAAAPKPPLPLLLIVPSEPESSRNAILPASQVEQVEVAANDKSEVQKQLELLYEKDGREMPDLKLNMQPLSPTKTSTPAAPATLPGAGQTTPSTTQKPSKVPPGYTKYQPAARPQATTSPVQMNSHPAKNYAAALSAANRPQPQVQSQAHASSQPRPNRFTGFFKRFVPVNRNAISTPPIPPDYVNSVPEVPSATLAPAVAMPSVLPNSKRGAIPLTPTVQMTTKPVLSPVPLQTSPMPLLPQAPIAVGFSPHVMGPPQPSLVLPQLAQQPLPLSNIAEPDFLPPLMTDPDPRALIANSKSDESKIMIPSKDAIIDFPNPFPEITEKQADLKVQSKSGSAQVPLDESEPLKEAQIADNSERSVEAPKSEENPFAVRVKDFAEPTIDENVEANTLSAVPELTKPDVAASANALDVPQAADGSLAIATMPPAPPMPEISGPALDVGALKPVEEVEDAYLEKMRRIRDRFGMKGLKGFCPVTLRDERELLDAKPEYFYTHRGQKFHFASAESRDKFEADPSIYAPAAYGADVVALGRDKDVVEGTLDFAAWFKGRLYLFGSQANYDTFVKSPATYASPAGIE